MRGRGNGLDAESFKPLTDLDPEAADVMLVALREAGVAAYVSTLEPRDADEEPEQIERLWVDATATSRARAILRSLTEPSSPRSRAKEATGGPADIPQVDPPRAEGADRAEPAKRAEPAEAATPAERPGDDEVWAQIVASFDTDVADPVPRWPVAEDLGGERPERDEPPTDGSFKVAVPAAGPRDYSLAPPGSPVIDELDEDPEEHFVPPPPPPLPKTDAATKVAWIALVGGPLYLLVSVLLGRPVGPWTSFAAFAAFTGGFVALVARMRRDRDEDDPDDGAVV
ncbi:hypothetical protein [Embleya sp. NPDC059259]|uniref:hypothetical protein n=1 Tax=unclassified Embleya TaxID=2699296 RepID=UPI0036BD9499